MNDDFNTPWQAVLETYLEPCMALLFPKVHQGVDGFRGVTFRNKELQPVSAKRADGVRIVDKLVEVRRRDGTPAAALIHVEVQTQERSDIAERMLTCLTRIRCIGVSDRRRAPAGSCAWELLVPACAPRSGGDVSVRLSTVTSSRSSTYFGT